MRSDELRKATVRSDTEGSLRDCDRNHKNSLLLDRTISEQEASLFRPRIHEHRGGRYYHRVVSEDCAGRRLQTPATQMCISSCVRLFARLFSRVSSALPRPERAPQNGSSVGVVLASFVENECGCVAAL
jgi:hypothetical protein